ncbi:hypothetical protein GCM10009546_03080 [Actinomadura livida]|uniref:Uncharacterized protein n=1 Tax=Actinomadura livida TaxID=79909 RepID=A0A7W7I7I5_9ACTN|nr:hypothetical protein [Actinomadura catellatispora]GGU03318.1 hypothetical protein GCM10010208_29320 [Actinomadura livida]
MASTNMSSPADVKAALKRDFPGWRFLRSDRGRWWALCGPLPPGRMNEVDTVVAETEEQLRVELAVLTGTVTS